MSIVFCFAVSKLTMLMNSSHYTMTPKNPLYLTLVLRETAEFQRHDSRTQEYGLETSKVSLSVFEGNDAANKKL